MAPKGFQLLEINIISAQDLEPISKKMSTYAKAWVHPNRKLSSFVDTEGHNNPTWNDKFVFRVDDAFLREDTSAVMIEIYSPNWFRHILVGTVRVLVGNLIPPPARTCGRQIGMRFIALQVRRPSGRPQGILNIGVTLLDGSLRSMPLYNDGMSAVGYRDLMQEQPHHQHPHQKDQNHDHEDDDGYNNRTSNLKPILRRSRSDRSERMALDNYSPRSSMVGVPTGFKDGSILSISEFVDPFIGTKMQGKASSVIGGMETPRQKGRKGKRASSVINGVELSEKPKPKGKKSKGSSMVNAPVYRKVPSVRKNESDAKPGPDESKEKRVAEIKATPETETSKEKSPLPTFRKPIVKPNGPQPQSKYVPVGRFKGSSILSGSEIGPSPSEVAAEIAERRYPLQDNESSVLDGWSLDESVEGLRSKLDRWRSELPPLYDHHSHSSASSYRSGSSVHRRTHSDNGPGLFSCFGNICGYEYQCVCGKPPGRKNRRKRFPSSSSIGSGSGSRSFA